MCDVNVSFNKFLNLYQRLKDMPDMVETIDVNSNGMLSSITVNGFSKSGTAEIVLIHDKCQVEIKTRYDQRDIREVDDNLFDQISTIAFDWYLKSESKGYTIPDIWAETWAGKGLIKKSVIVRYVMA